MINVRCPICERQMIGESTAEWPDFPFCGKRCRLIDLGRWLGEDYRYRLDPEADGDAPAQDTEDPGIP